MFKWLVAATLLAFLAVNFGPATQMSGISVATAQCGPEPAVARTAAGQCLKAAKASGKAVKYGRFEGQCRWYSFDRKVLAACGLPSSGQARYCHEDCALKCKATIPEERYLSACIGRWCTGLPPGRCQSVTR